VPKRAPEIDLLLQFLDESFDHPAWHGTNLRGSVRRLSAEEAAWRPSKERHNIWEIVVHCAYWKYAVRRRILGEKRGSFPEKGSNWFNRPSDGSEDEWQKDISLLEQMHRSLRQAIVSLPTSRLKKKVAGSKWTTVQTISGAASHDLYHAGQIQLLKKLLPKKG